MKGWMIQRLLNGVNLFLFGFLILFSIKIFREGFGPQDKNTGFPESKEKRIVKTLALSEEGPLSLKEPLFGKPKIQEKIDVPIKLIGTASVNERLFAAVEFEGTQMLVKEGQILGSWTVVKITEQEIFLENHTGDTFSSTRENSLSVSSTDLNTVELKKIDENRIVLDRETVQDIFSHWADLFRDVRVFPYVEKGVSKGYVLLNVGPDSLVRKLGLRTGDIVKKINGSDVTDLQALLAIYDHLDGEKLVIDLKRGPKDMQLVFEIKKS